MKMTRQRDGSRLVQRMDPTLTFPRVGPGQLKVEHITVESHAKVVFHNSYLTERFCEYIEQSHSVVGCVAWFTSRQILNALQPKPSCILLKNEDYLDSRSREFDKTLREFMNQVTFYPNRDQNPRFGDVIQPFMVVSPVCGIMHNKFIVLEREDKPYAVITGSFNFTNNARSNLENIVYIESEKIADGYRKYWSNILEAASSLL